MSRNTSIIDSIYHSAISHTIILTTSAAHTVKRRLYPLAVSLTADCSLKLSDWRRLLRRQLRDYIKYAGFSKQIYVYSGPFPLTFSQLEKVYVKGPFSILKIYVLKGRPLSNCRIYAKGPFHILKMYALKGCPLYNCITVV